MTSERRSKTGPKTPAPRTLTDPNGSSPVLVDPLVRLRRWGQHPDPRLEFKEADDISIGTASTCKIRIDEPGVSGLHASVFRRDARWFLSDLASKNQTRVDGVPQTEAPLEPGSEIEIGKKVRLIAESARSIALRSFLARVIGSTDDRLNDLDFALRAIRTTAARRAPLVLYGSDDLVSIAYDIHCLAFGERRPFALCAPERTAKDRVRRGVSIFATAADAVVGAAGGSICVWESRRPSEFGDLAQSLALPGTVAQLVVVGRELAAVQRYEARPIEIPPLHDRADELERIVGEYADDARERLSTSIRLHTKGREWVHRHCIATLGEIQKGTERLLALKHFGTFARAAAWLGISAQGLSNWMGARDITTVKSTEGF